MLVEFLHEIMKQQTSLSVIDFSPLHSTIPLSVPKQHVFFSFLIGRYTKIHAANKFSEKGFNNKSIMCLTFHQSKPVYSEPPACQSCCPGPATGSHLVSFCSANHEVHFLRRSSYQDPLHQQHNCSKQEVGKLLVFIIQGLFQLNH